LLAALSALPLTTGCHSTKHAVSGRMAYVIVTNHPSERIEAAVRKVFKKHAYEESKGGADELDFQRPVSFMNGLVYGDLYSGGVWERVKVYQRELDPERTIVECDGYFVQEHDDPLFQKEKPEYKTKQGHLHGLMKEVARELIHPSPASD
jgi:hypothetical protein